jgi:hypothetical protein
MFDPFEMGSEFFEGLMAMDEAIVAQAAAEPCRDCGGPLYRGDYPRKPLSTRVPLRVNMDAGSVRNRRNAPHPPLALPP